MTDYASNVYWDQRYAKDGGTFDWYQNYTGLKYFLAPYMSSTSRILMVGCGTSELSEDMYLDGLQNIVNVDISAVACDVMRAKHKDKPLMEWRVSDVMGLKEFPDAHFDAAVDKGTLDALLCGKDGDAAAKAACRAISRVLKPGGAFVNITYGAPPSRQHYFTRPSLGWTLRPVLTVPQSHGAACTCGGCIDGHGNTPVQPQPGARRPPDPKFLAALSAADGTATSTASTATSARTPALSASAKRIAEAEEWNDEDFHFVYVCVKHTAEEAEEKAAAAKAAAAAAAATRAGAAAGAAAGAGPATAVANSADHKSAAATGTDTAAAAAGAGAAAAGKTKASVAAPTVADAAAAIAQSPANH